MALAPGMQDLLSDRRRLIETVVPIENKNRELVPFILNPIQADMHDTFTGRDVNVKPAQAGGTSYFICDALLDCLMTPGTTAVIISYDEFITGRLLRKAQSFYDNLNINVPNLPKLHHKSVSEKTFIFEDSLGVKRGESSFYIASAQKFSMPRGEPIHFLFMDELGFWPTGAAEDVFASAMQRVPLLTNTKVIALSTPNGEDNDFYDLYMAAKEGRQTGTSIFTHHFYPWFALPEYSMVQDSSFCLPDDNVEVLIDLEDDEAALMERWSRMKIDYAEANNKLRWRRFKLAEMSSLKRSGETRRLFSQEYPEDDVSCFLSAEGQWYEPMDINKMIRECYPAQMHRLGADIWYMPEEKIRYLVAVDPGLGKKSDSVATVWSFTETEYKHHATLSGKYAGAEMAARCIPLARFYNNATIAVEDALDITSHITSYPNLYYRTDPVTGKVSNNIGWQTNPATKVYMCNELKRAMPKIVTHDERIPKQCRNIREGTSRGRVIPQSVGADDYHDSASIAIVCRTALPITRGFVGAAGWSPNW